MLWYERYPGRTFLLFCMHLKKMGRVTVQEADRPLGAIYFQKNGGKKGSFTLK